MTHTCVEIAVQAVDLLRRSGVGNMLPLPDHARGCCSAQNAHRKAKIQVLASFCMFCACVCMHAINNTHRYM